MDKGEDKGFLDVWEIDHSKYGADSDNVEEVVTEITTESGGEKIDQGPEDEKPEGITVDDQPEETKGAEKQAEEPADVKTEEKDTAASEERKEDASAKQVETETPEAVEESGIFDLAQGLVDDDILVFDDSDEEIDFDTEEGLKHLINKTVEQKSADAINSFKENLGDEAKGLLDILEKGGSVTDYVNMTQQIDFSKVPLETSNGEQAVKNQQYLVEDWMKVQGYEEDEIQEMLADYNESGLLRKQAEIAQKKLAAWQTKENETLLAQKAQEQAQAEQESAEQAEAFREEVQGMREIAGFKVTEAKAKKLYDFITKEDKEGQTAFAKADSAENRLLYALFAMEGFDKDKLSKEVAREQTRKLKRKLSNYNDKNVAPKRGAQQVRRSDQGTPDINVPWL